MAVSYFIAITNPKSKKELKSERQENVDNQVITHLRTYKNTGNSRILFHNFHVPSAWLERHASSSTHTLKA